MHLLYPKYIFSIYLAFYKLLYFRDLDRHALIIYTWNLACLTSSKTKASPSTKLLSVENAFHLALNFLHEKSNREWLFICVNQSKNDILFG
ncbi:hypothetical protein GIB67_000021 [Kingdonia uniflora]|uniref:Uncharacterized protein n=1 Tax=Kingdonia uniflora TaxID=39325 RepID=A0A7J7MNU0_9MAGN|nr:hypothetical protein GIB67_000021 [Kingdonia uniflora]